MRLRCNAHRPSTIGETLRRKSPSPHLAWLLGTLLCDVCSAAASPRRITSMLCQRDLASPRAGQLMKRGSSSSSSSSPNGSTPQYTAGHRRTEQNRALSLFACREFRRNDQVSVRLPRVAGAAGEWLGHGELRLHTRSQSCLCRIISTCPMRLGPRTP